MWRWGHQAVDLSGRVALLVNRRQYCVAMADDVPVGVACIIIITSASNRLDFNHGIDFLRVLDFRAYCKRPENGSTAIIGDKQLKRGAVDNQV